MSPIHELLATLRAEIADEEERFMQLREMARAQVGEPFSADAHTADLAINEAFHKMQMRLTPVRREIDLIIRALAEIEALKPPKPFIISSSQAYGFWS